MNLTIKLAEAKERQTFTVTQITDEEVTWQALRFGIEEGSLIEVQKNIAGGPVIVAKNQMEIAIGRTIAESIEVTPCLEPARGHN